MNTSISQILLKVIYPLAFLFSLVILIILPSHGLAQELSPILGYIVSWEGDTINGQIIPEDAFKNQKQINFIDKYGVVATYHPDRISGFGYGDSANYHSRPMPYLYAGLFAEERVFLKLLRKGPANLYRFYSRRSVFTLKKGAGYFEILQKPDGSWHEVSLIFGWKHTAQVFDEYPELANRIRAREFNPEQMLEVIDLYNEWYLSK